MARRTAGRAADDPPEAEATDPLEARRRRAAREPLDVRVVETSPHLRLRVRNAIHGTTYEVHLPEYPERGGALCTCPDFSRRGMGTCKHIEAAWLQLDADGGVGVARPRPGLADGPAIWKRIDRI